MEFNDSKNDSHVTECSVRPRPSLASACCYALGKEGFVFLKKISLPSVLDLALGKDFFLENTLPSAPDTALDKEFFFEMSLLSAPVKALGKEDIFFKKSKTIFAECLILGTRQRPHLPSAMPWHSAKFFYFLFLASKFFVQPF